LPVPPELRFPIPINGTLKEVDLKILKSLRIHKSIKKGGH